MHKLRMKTLVVSCSLALAGGCALPVVPVSNVTHSADVTDPNYQIGRSNQGRLQYDAAIAAYRKSLEANPGNAEAHNALGVIYATQGKYEQAIVELKAALALAPTAAHIHNNLGYAYLLQGRNADALAALNVASGLDPANERSRENIKLARQRLGQEAPNAPEARIAAATPAISTEVKTGSEGKAGQTTNWTPASETLVAPVAAAQSGTQGAGEESGKAAAMQPPPVATDASGVYLQLGAFRSQDNADNYLARLRTRIDWLAPLLHVYPKDGLFRVHAGPYANQAEARAAAGRIGQALGIKAMVLTR